MPFIYIYEPLLFADPFQEYVVKSLTKIEQNIEVLCGIVTKLASAKETGNFEEENEDLRLRLPCISIADVDAFEKDLDNKEFRKYMVVYF